MNIGLSGSKPFLLIQNTWRSQEPIVEIVRVDGHFIKFKGQSI